MRIVLSIFLLSPFGFLGQTHELDDAIHKKAIDFAEIDIDSTFFYAKNLQNSDNFCRALIGHYYESNVSYKRSDYVSCERKLNYILDQIATEDQSATFQYSELMVGQTYEEVLNIIKINIYRRFFYMRLNKNCYSEAFDFLELQHACIEQLKIKDFFYIRKSVVLKLSHAALHRKVGNYEESLRILNEIAQKIDTVIIELTDPSYNYFQLERAHIFHDLARNYEFLLPDCPTFIDSVDYYTDMTYNATKKLKNRSIENDRSHFIRKSHVNLLRKDFLEAIHYADKAMKLSVPEEGTSIALLMQARCRSGLNQHDSAIYYAKAFLRLDTLGGLHKSDQLTAYNILAESYYNQELLDSAYRYSNKTQTEIQAETFNKYDTQERLSQQRVQEFMALNDKINKKRMSLRYQLFLSIGLAVILVSGMCFLFIQKRRKHHEKISNLQEKYTVLKSSIGHKSKTRKIDDHLLNRVLKELDKIEKSTIFLDPSFTLSSLSKLLNTNTNYLSKIINQHKNKGFRQYLMELRINRLIQLLNERTVMRKYSIKAMAKAVGYSNASSFTRAFKGHMDISPSEYLKQTYPEEFT